MAITIAELMMCFFGVKGFHWVLELEETVKEKDSSCCGVWNGRNSLISGQFGLRIPM
jgi:hypothetical protein